MGIQVIRFNSALKNLDLRGNIMGDQGAIGLSSSLRVIGTLTKLELGYNEIKDKGAYAIAEALKNNSDTTIDQIELGNNYISQLGQVRVFPLFFFPKKKES